MFGSYIPLELPEELRPLLALALDLRWTWSHEADALWRQLDPRAWEQLENPWVLLQEIDRRRLEEMAADPAWMEELRRLDAERRGHLADPGWFGHTHAGELGGVAYFSMEFGLGEALPLYAGGLGVLAGDHLKAASDLGVPLTGIGLLYHQGYFRQVLGPGGEQGEAYPFNDPSGLPVQPVLGSEGGWLHVPLNLPGRVLQIRLWSAQVGRVELLLLDTNDPANSPADRGITGTLYGGSQEMRVLQEIVLGVGGWRALRALGKDPDVLHLNEGHAAFALVERARGYMRRNGGEFGDALWATRPGNIFTTHTPLPAGMDVYGTDMISRYEPVLRDYVAGIGLQVQDFLGLGRANPVDPAEPFNMAYLALRGCGAANGVSRLHGAVSRRLFQGLFPRWPEREVPVTYVTNGVHVPTWDSPAADRLWEKAAGKERWRGTLAGVIEALSEVDAEALWALRAEARRTLVDYVRRRLARQLGYHGVSRERIESARHVFDVNALTLGFARRITEYKRPTMLLRDRDRFARLLSDSHRPVQIVVAGKAHPADPRGRAMVGEWVEFSQDPRVRGHVVFLEDYDMRMAQELVRGVDVWINTPRRPLEASGTSGMKVLVNGGLNLSELDGWWAEAFRPDAGWALGDVPAGAGEDVDTLEAEQLYHTLESSVVPEFYTRGDDGLPRRWIDRMRVSMAVLAPQFSANRMVREYTERLYLPAAVAIHRRQQDGAACVGRLRDWETRLSRNWHEIRFGNVSAAEHDGRWCFNVQVYLGDIHPDDVAVELYAEAVADHPTERIRMEPAGRLTGAVHGEVYQATIPATRPRHHYTPRVIPDHPEAIVPGECPRICWYE